MDEWILAHQSGLRMGFFFGLLAVFGVWEALAPGGNAGFPEPSGGVPT